MSGKDETKLWHLPELGEVHSLAGNLMSELVLVTVVAHDILITILIRSSVEESRRVCWFALPTLHDFYEIISNKNFTSVSIVHGWQSNYQQTPFS